MSRVKAKYREPKIPKDSPHYTLWHKSREMQHRMIAEDLHAAARAHEEVAKQHKKQFERAKKERFK